MGAEILGVFGTWFVCLFVKASSVPSVVASETIPSKLRELAALRDAGVITRRILRRQRRTCSGGCSRPAWRTSNLPGFAVALVARV